MPVSNPVTDGVNATGTQYNDLRTDAITVRHTYKFEVKGSLAVGNEQGGIFAVENAAETVVGIKRFITSGTSATVRVQKNTTDVEAGMSATTSVAEETTITSPALTENQKLTMDITGVSGAPVDLVVQVKTEYTKV